MQKRRFTTYKNTRIIHLHHNWKFKVKLEKRGDKNGDIKKDEGKIFKRV